MSGGTEMELVHRGSVKNIFSADLNPNSSTTKTRHLFFQFSDRYSIFDWGEMPDLITHKGKVLAVMADRFFQLLSNPKTWQELKAYYPNLLDLFDSQLYKRFCLEGMPHHCLGLDDQNRLKVQAVDILKPQALNTDAGLDWNYQIYQTAPKNALVPLEVVFRFGVPRGSSLLKRTGNADYLKSLGLVNPPSEGDVFERPVIEYSTKLEPTDRYLAYTEAKKIAGLNEKEWDELHTQVSLCALMLKTLFSKMQIELLDGKFEFAFTENRQFMMVDSIGPDELRLTFQGVQLSKENLRQFYREGLWAKNCEEAKLLAKKRGEADWKKICTQELNSHPLALESGQVELISQMYQTLLNEVLKLNQETPLFPQAPSLAEWLKSWQSELQRL